MERMNLDKLIGPRLSREALAREGVRFALPTFFLSLAAVLLIASIFLPYWRLKLLAPQYPGGLVVQAYLDRVEGDVREIDGLNHYIGMRPLGEAAQLEKSLSIAAVVAIALLVIGAVYIHNRIAAFLALPAVLFPAVFLIDLYFWLRSFGTNLDPTAPLSSSIKPFVPPVLGYGKVGQFGTVAMPDLGLVLAALASVLILLGLFFHRRAYRPLVLSRSGRGEGASTD